MQYPSTLDSNVEEGVVPDTINFHTDPSVLLQIFQLQDNDTMMDFMTYVLKDATVNHIILNQINNTKYANMSALTFTAYTDYDVTKFVALQRDDQIYQFVSSFHKDHYNVETFDKMINSLRFF
jgi:hypothetical protein